MKDNAQSPSEIYDLNVNRYKRLSKEIDYALKSQIEAHNIKIHSVTSRVKDRNSYLEKIERKNYSNPEEQVEDIVGLRVVCLFTSDLKNLHNIIHSTFQVADEENKIDEAPVESFGYMSVHYICVIDSTNSGPRYDDLKNIKFEVQCRTILMDAWANVSHYLAYKQGSGLPSRLQKDFHALAGLFHVADSQFESFYTEAMKSQKEATSIVADPSLSRHAAVNRDTLKALLERFLPERTSDEPEYIEGVAELSEELTIFGYKNIHAVAIDLERAKPAALEYEKSYPASDEDSLSPIQYDAIGLTRQALAISNRDYANFKYNTTSMFSNYEPYRKLMDI